MRSRNVKRRVIQLVAVLSILGLFGPMAEAHVADFSTSLTLKVDDSKIRKGHYVTFISKLSSSKTKCYANRSVSLYKNGNFMSKKRTDPTGKVQFSRRVFTTSDWRTKFLGFTFGTHPHRHTCLKSTSNKVTVTVN